MARVFAFGKDRWDPTNRFETSWILPPYVLGFCRALFVSGETSWSYIAAQCH